MTWLAPWALAAAAGAAAGVVLLHFLARDRPPRWTLPTARFVPAGSARATRRARSPRDILLLALRVLAILLAGAGFAGPTMVNGGGRVAPLVLVDRAGVLRDSSQLAAGPRGRVIAYDSSLGAAFALALRASPALADDADSIALTIASPFAAATDRATERLRREWPGRITFVRTEPVARDSLRADARLGVRGPSGDAVVAAARLIGAQPVARGLPGGTLLLRGAPTAADSAVAHEGSVIISWPAVVPPPGGDVSTDSVSGFVAGDAVVLFSAKRAGAPPEGRVVARWVDGTPAATEVRVGRGCIRTVAVPVPLAGDLTLRPAFRRALRRLAAPCGGDAAPALHDSVLARLAGTGPLAPAVTLRRAAERSPATPWLLGAALLLLLLEPVFRRASPVRPGEAA